MEVFSQSKLSGSAANLVELLLDDGSSPFESNGHDSEFVARLNRQQQATFNTRCNQDDLPCIPLDGSTPLRDQSDSAIKALSKANGDNPFLFQRAGKLVQLQTVEAVTFKGGSTHKTIVEEVTFDELKGLLTRSANFVLVKQNGQAIHVEPPMSVVKDVLALGKWPFPSLIGVTEVPAIRADGSILNVPGYDAATQLVYVPSPDFDMPDIPEYPTRQEAREAVTVIEEAIWQFPFDSEDSYDNALGAILTPIVRPAIDGQVMLGLVDATKPGTGKSKLVNIPAFIATGRKAAVISPPESEAEWRKTVTTTVLEGTLVNIIDNIQATLRSASLDAMITAPAWKARLLGRNENIDVPNRGFWMGTGNNITLGGDLARRVFWIRLDAGVAKPWKRRGIVEKHDDGDEDFREDFKDLEKWLEENRGQLVAACLIIARAWYVAGRPKRPNAPIVGSFENWADVIGGMLAYVGHLDFLSNLDTQLDAHDWEGNQWALFLARLHEEYGDTEFTTAGIVRHITMAATTLERDGISDAVMDALPDYLSETRSIGDFKKRLGIAFSHKVGTIYDDETRLALQRRVDSHTKQPYWRVTRLPEPKRLNGKLRVVAGS